MTNERMLYREGIIMKRWLGIMLSVMLALNSLQAPVYAAGTGQTATAAQAEEAGIESADAPEGDDAEAGNAAEETEEELYQETEEDADTEAEPEDTESEAAPEDAVAEPEGTESEAAPEGSDSGAATEDEMPEAVEEDAVSETVQEASAQAEEAQEQSEPGEQTEPDVIIEYIGDEMVKSTPAMYNAKAADGAVETFTNRTDALDYVREKAKEREEEIGLIVPKKVFDQLDKERYSDVFEHTGDPSGGDYLFCSLASRRMWYCPWNDSGTEYAVVYYFNYRDDADEAAEADAVVNGLVFSLGLTDSSKSDYDKIKAIHDYIADNVEYDYDTYYGETTDYPETYTGYGAIVKHLAVCQGFAAMFYRLCLEAGIDARIIDSRQQNHAWNIVRLEGLYYLMDCTWDENSGSDKYFLCGRYDFRRHGNTDDQFQDAAFAARYPLSDYKYGFEIKSLGKAPDYTLITQDGRTVSTAAQNGRAKVLIFFSESHSYFLYTMQTLRGKEYSGVDFVYANIMHYRTADQRRILEKIGSEMPADVPGVYALCSNASDARLEFEEITGIYDDSGYVYPATVFLISPDNEILYAERGYNGEIGTLVEAMLEDADLPEAPEPDDEAYAGFTEIGICGKKAVWRYYGGEEGVYEKGTLVISGTGELLDNRYYITWTGWLNDWQGEDSSYSGYNIHSDEVRRVIIEDGITYIGQWDFDGFTSLESITFNGAAPEINGLHGVDQGITIYFPDDDESWENVDRNLFSGDSKWISQDADGVHHHKWGEQTVTKEATCTKEGAQESVCTECGDKISEVIPAKGHTWNDDFTTDKAATCTEEGAESIHCAVCGEIKEGSERTLEKIAHAYGEWVTVTDANCESEGLRKKACTVCGEEVKEEIPAKGHIWNDDYMTDKVATCTEEGSESIHCIVCGEIKENSERTLEKIAHAYGNWVTVTDANCESEGLRKKVCTVCGENVTEAIPAAGHKWAEEYTVDKQPTKAEEGAESIHCEVCGAIKEGSERAIPMINKDPQVLTITPAVSSVIMGKTVNLTVAGAEGTLTCETGDSSMATAMVSGTKITVKGVKTGTVKLIVRAAETADYEAAEEAFELTVLPGKTTRGDMFNLANNVKVTWTAVPGAKYYKIYREGVTVPGESRSDPVIVTTGLVGWDKDPGLTNGHAYRYRIVASLTGKGDASGDSMLSYSKLMYRLKTVVIRSVKNTAPGKVTVKYDKTISGDSYVLQYCERQDMVGAKTKVVLGAKNTSYVIGGLKKGKTYYISIRVRKKVNGSDYYTTFGGPKKIKITQ